MEAQEFYKGEIVRVCNKFSSHFGETGMVVGNEKGKSEIMDDAETTYYWVTLGPLMYKFDFWELRKADQKEVLKADQEKAPKADQKEVLKTEHHYDGAVQPIELMQAQMTFEEFIGFLKGNIIKYVSRLGKKDAPEREVMKIIQYTHWLLKAVKGQTIDPREK